MLTTQRLVERSLRNFSERIALIDPAGSMTFSSLRERTGRLANALIALGADETRPVAALLPNESRTIEVDVAAMRAGICRVAIGTRLGADECRFIVNHSKAAVLVTTPALWESIAGPELESLSHVLLVGEARKPTAAGDGRVRDYEATLAEAASAFTAADVAPDHPAYLLYTSGTTGRPKGALHSHGTRVAAMVNMLAAEIRANADSVMVHAGPLSHGSGSKVLTFLALGATNLVLPKFDPELFAQRVTQHGGSHSFMVPTMIQMLLDGGPKVREAVRGMSQLSFGGAPITDTLFGRAVAEFGPILTQVYGSCEAPHPITVMTPEDYGTRADPGEVAQYAGRASVGTDIAVVDEAGVECPVGEEGELQVRGAHIMSGYWRDEAATAEVFRPGGWYATGDIAVIDAAGYVSFRDRKRDLIISGGLNVYPSEVERVLADHENVREVAVVSAPDERWGETVVACVVPVDPDAADAQAIIDWVGARLAGYKKPRRVVFLDTLPKGSTNKVLKRELKARFWEGRTRMVN